MLTEYQYHYYLNINITNRAQTQYLPLLGSLQNSYDTIVMIYRTEEILCIHSSMSHGHPAQQQKQI